MTDTPIRKKLPFTVRQRLEHIEKCLFWKGEVKRADITGAFGVNPAQAATDFRDYMALAPGNMEYNPSVKRYWPTESFVPVLIHPSSLSEFIELENPFVPVAQWPFPKRYASTAALQGIIRAVRNHESVEIRYQSMTDPSPSWRRISPHAFASDGIRWHARCYYHKHQDFRDFVLSRIQDVRKHLPCDISPDADIEWNTFVDILITPNPKLSPEQQSAIAKEYNMPKAAKLRMKIRKAMLFYVEAQFNPSQIPAARQVLVEVLR